MEQSITVKLEDEEDNLKPVEIKLESTLDLDDYNENSSGVHEEETHPIPNAIFLTDPFSRRDSNSTESTLQMKTENNDGDSLAECSTISAKKVQLSPKEERMKAVLRAVKAVREEKWSLNTAAKMFQVPRSTLSDKLRGKTPLDATCGPRPIFTKEEEKILEDWILCCSRRRFPVSREQILISAGKLMKEVGRENPFINNSPGKKWLKLFLKRHPKISLRAPRNFKISPTKVTRLDIQDWYTEVGTYFTANALKSVLSDPSRVFSAGEAALFFNPEGDKILVERDSKKVHGIVNVDGKECLTALITVSAAGQILPPVVIFKYVRVPKKLAESVPGNWGIGLSNSGWMTAEGFFEYTANIFHNWLTENNIPRPVIFFINAETPYPTLHLSRFCFKNGIVLVTLPPNATHLMQPVDVTVFSTLKQVWKKQVHDYCTQRQQPLLYKTDFCPVLENTIKTYLMPSIIQNGFRKCGLVPFDQMAIDYSNMSSGEEQNFTYREKSLVSCNKFKITAETISKLIGPDKTEFFRHNLNRSDFEDYIAREDISLFKVWRYCVDNPQNLMQDTSPPSEEIANEYPNLIERIVDSMYSNSTTDASIASLEGVLNGTDLISSVISPENKLSSEFASNSRNLTSSTQVPCGEQSVLFRDSASTASKLPTPLQEKSNVPNETNKKKLKEKLPIVAKSKDWTLYFKKKEKEKQEADLIKQKKNNDKRKVDEDVCKDDSEFDLDEPSSSDENQPDKIRKRKTITKELKNNKKQKVDEDDQFSEFHDTDDDTTSSSENLSDNIPPIVYKKNDFVIARYREKFFPGLILATDKETATVKAMVPAGLEVWKWPPKDDICRYVFSDIRTAIKAPILCNKRGHYKVPEMKKFSIYVIN